MKRPPYLFLCLALLLQAAKCQKDVLAPADQLPPATQLGANTFGCLVNGALCRPKGNTGTPNFSVQYDPTANGGDLNLHVTQIEGEHERYFTLLAAPVTGTGTYSFARPTGPCAVHYVQTPAAPNGCTQLYSDQAVAYRSGQLTITRLDTQARIIAGVFNLQLLRAGCDTIRITQGRFDAQF
jgi:hypothetical protein